MDESEIVDRLDILIKLTALNSVAGKSITEQIRILMSVGLRPVEISRIIDKPVNTVTGLIARLKKKSDKNESKEHK